MITAAVDRPEFEQRDRWTGAITESLSYGSDRSDRFQTVTRWREEPVAQDARPRLPTKPASESNAWKDGRRGDSRGRAGQEESAFVYMVNVKTRIVTGWIMAGAWLLGWLGCRHISNNGGLSF